MISSCGARGIRSPGRATCHSGGVVPHDRVHGHTAAATPIHARQSIPAIAPARVHGLIGLLVSTGVVTTNRVVRMGNAAPRAIPTQRSPYGARSCAAGAARAAI